MHGWYLTPFWFHMPMFSIHYANFRELSLSIREEFLINSRVKFIVWMRPKGRFGTKMLEIGPASNWVERDNLTTKHVSCWLVPRWAGCVRQLYHVKHFWQPSFWHVGLLGRRNQSCQILTKSVQGLGGAGGWPEIAFSIDMRCRPCMATVLHTAVFIDVFIVAFSSVLYYVLCTWY